MRTILSPEEIFSSKTLDVNSIVIKITNKQEDEDWLPSWQWSCPRSLRELLSSFCLDTDNYRLPHKPLYINYDGKEIINHMIDDLRFDKEVDEIDYWNNNIKLLYRWNDSYIKINWLYNKKGNFRGILIKLVKFDEMPSLGFWQEPGMLLARMFGQGEIGYIYKAWHE